MDEQHKQQIEAIRKDIEVFVDARLAKYSWRIIAFVAVPLLFVAVGWGALTLQVRQNTATIENSVLTVKDKDNLEIKIVNLSEKLDNNNASVIKAIDNLRAEIRSIR